MAVQLRIYVPPHPLLRHWLTVVRDRQTPVPMFRTAVAEIGRWLTYEACREWLPTQQVTVETPLAETTGEVLAVEVPVAIVPVLRAGLVMVESCLSILPLARVYHLGLVRDEETLTASCYLNRLPGAIAPETRIMISEPMLATGGTIIQVLAMLTERGADPSLIRILSVICAPPALKKVQEQFPAVQIYSAAIDEVVNEKGWIVPGLGDAGDRAFGTLAE